MSASLSRGPRDVTFRDPGNVPEHIDTICRTAADNFILRDAEALAHHAGLSPRVVNHQRERNVDRKSALETNVRMLWGARRLGWAFERRLLLVRPVLDALCADAYPRRVQGSRESALITAANATLEASQAVATLIAALADGEISMPELSEIRRECQEAVDTFHRLVREAEIAAGAAPTEAVGA